MDKKRILSWCLYDFANSSYSAVIAAVVFPVFYANLIVGNERGLGDLWWGKAISLSMAMVAVSSPFMGGIADFGGLRKRFLMVLTILCVSAVSAFSILKPGMVLSGFLLVVVANFAMESGLVFYNSFLPVIAPRGHEGRVSSWGFGLGYAGSILSLLIALLFVKKSLYAPTWLSTACFYLVFSIPAFVFLPADRRTETGVLHAARKAFSFTWKTFREIWGARESRRFLIAYLIYEDGVNTVIVFSSLFASVTLGFKPEELVLLYIVVQISALVGAFVMARPVDLWGPKKVVLGSLVLWTSVCAAAYFVHEKTLFWIVATVAGTGLGTVQAATRAFFSGFIPEGRESEYFGVYSMVGKTSAVLGPLVFGFVSSTFGSQRPAILSVGLFFVIGLLVLRTVRGGGPTSREREEAI